MADLYLKALESERKKLWATCRLKGLPRDSMERQRIAMIDEDIAAHKAKQGKPDKPKSSGPKPAKPKPAKAKPAKAKTGKPTPAQPEPATPEPAKPES